MTTSQTGIDFIKRFEGLRLKPYLCSAGKPTIGYGSTFYPNGRRVTLLDIPITEGQAEKLLADTIKPFEKKVNIRINVPLTQNQFDALVAHTFNTGGSDTLFRLVNQRADMSLIEDWWTSRYVTSDGKRLDGLVRRRKEEFELYRSENQNQDLINWAKKAQERIKKYEK